MLRCVVFCCTQCALHWVVQLHSPAGGLGCHGVEKRDLRGGPEGEQRTRKSSQELSRGSPPVSANFDQLFVVGVSFV